VNPQDREALDSLVHIDAGRMPQRKSPLTARR
jgi:hypothetical protein